MDSTATTIGQLFRRGEFEAVRRVADISPAGLRRLPLDCCLSIAHALALLNLNSSTEDVISHCLNSQRPSINGYIELVKGIIAENIGRAKVAESQYVSALEKAQTCSDFTAAGWAHVRLLRLAVDGGTATASDLLPKVRRTVIGAADVHVTAYLHQTVSVMEGQAGRIAEAKRHCDIVDSLLRTSPNSWLQGGNLVNRACLALLDSSLHAATTLLLEAKKSFAVSGTRSSAVESNLAHIQLITGRFSEAIETAAQVVRSERSGRMARTTALEQIARAYLAMGELDECKRRLDQLEEEAIRDPELRCSFGLRWAVAARARHLMHCGDFGAAVGLLGDALSTQSEGRDEHRWAALNLLQAAALSQIGDEATAAKHLWLSATSSSGKSGLLLGHYYDAAATVTPTRQLGAQLRKRARHVWREQSVSPTMFQMFPHARTEEAKRDRRHGPTDQIIQTLESAAALFDLDDFPRLREQEISELLRRAGCLGDAAKVSGPTQDVLSTEVAIPVGAGLSLKCPEPRHADTAIAVTALQTLASAAVALGRAREEQRNRAALWPADPVEEQAGALFPSDEMQALLATARRAAVTNVPVLITGETGTGKEVLARTIHACSPRAKAAFLPFNCTSTPKDMLDSQLFGHRRGAFTGATDHFPGVIRGAAGGTLFLDEIGDMGLDVQPKLLRFLESGEIHPVGEAHPQKADVRVVAATNADLDTLVANGRFREDLFYRLNIVRLQLPPLRERRVEIPALAHHYLQKHALEFGKGHLRFAEETMEYLVLYRWPGNVRQLANEVRRMAALCEPGAVLMPEHLSSDIAASRRTVPAAERTLDPTEVVVRLDQPMPAAIEHLERAMLLYALNQCGGRMEDTAARLGLSRKGLYLKRQRFGIDPPVPPAAGAA